ncbi:hypothetical protein BH10PLA2_BH10PLA2_24780 [soil metagenome]
MRARYNKPIGKWTYAEICFLFFAFPICSGLGLLAFTLLNAWHRANDLSVADWCWQVGYTGLLGLGLCTALPAAGWQELARRQRERALLNKASKKN